MSANSKSKAKSTDIVKHCFTLQSHVEGKYQCLLCPEGSKPLRWSFRVCMSWIWDTIMDWILTSLVLTLVIFLPASVHFKRHRSEANPGPPGWVQGRNRRRRNHGPQRGQGGKKIHHSWRVALPLHEAWDNFANRRCKRNSLAVLSVFVKVFLGKISVLPVQNFGT